MTKTYKRKAMAEKAAAKLDDHEVVETEDGFVVRPVMLPRDEADAENEANEMAHAAEAEAEDDGEVATKGVVPVTYRNRYKERGHADRCGDSLSNVLKDELTIGDGKSRTLDLERLAEIASAHGLAEKLDGYTHLNPGMRRMNIGNILRAMVKRGEHVKIGETEWNAEAAV